MPSRQCERCNGHVPERMSRQRDGEGLLVCSECAARHLGRALTASYSDDERAVAQAFLDWFDGKIAHQDFGRLLDDLEDQGKVTDTIRRLDQCGPYGWEGSKQDGVALAESIVGKTATRKIAHDSGNNAIINHCPFCGSGALVGTSNGSITCDYCHTVCTVQVQPAHPFMPQTINGAPMPPPGMPDGTEMEMSSPVDPAVDEDVDGTPTEGFGEAEVDAAEMAGMADPLAEQQVAGMPIAAGLRTSEGALLDRERYLAHVALKMTEGPDRLSVLSKIRSRNQGD